MKTQTFDEVKEFMKDFSFIPICKEIFADVITPINLLKKMEASSKNFFLLEIIKTIFVKNIIST